MICKQKNTESSCVNVNGGSLSKTQIDHRNWSSPSQSAVAICLFSRRPGTLIRLSVLVALLQVAHCVWQADDDTYIIAENLRYFLSGENSSEPVMYGHHFQKFLKEGFFSGGSGYVLSKEALRRYGEKGEVLLNTLSNVTWCGLACFSRSRCLEKTSRFHQHSNNRTLSCSVFVWHCERK